LALLRIEIELRRHAGRGNGKLIVTKEQFVEYMRVHPRLIAPALRELEALGLICIDHGRGGNGEHRQPNRFLLNYLCGAVDAHELITNSWKQFKTLEEAAKVAAEARKAKDVAKVNYGRRNAAHKNISRGHLVYLTPRTLSVPESPKLPGTLGVPTAPGPLSVPTSDISGGGGAKGGWSLKKRRAAEAAPAHTRFGGNAGPPLLEWTTRTLTEIACTDELRQLYAATEPVPAIDLLKLSRGVWRQAALTFHWQKRATENEHPNERRKTENFNGTDDNRKSALERICRRARPNGGQVRVRRRSPRYVHRHARTVMEDMGKIDIEGSVAYFRDHGGYCDCEILLNVDRDWLWADAEPFESWPYQLDLYMRFRADREGVEYALSPEFFLANPADSYFGVIVRDDELIADKQNPEALEAWKHGEKK
jgi:hypothetical protein